MSTEDEQPMSGAGASRRRFLKVGALGLLGAAVGTAAKMAPVSEPEDANGEARLEAAQNEFAASARKPRFL